jgi:TPR repeat protein
MKKKGVFIVTAVVLMILPCIGVSAAKGEYNTGVRLKYKAEIEMQKSGENNPKVLKLYTQAIEAYKECIEINGKYSYLGFTYRDLGQIFYTGPRTLRNYNEAIMYMNEAIEILSKQIQFMAFAPFCYNEIGNILYILGDFYSSYYYYQKAAELANITSAGLAFMNWLGLGTEQNLPKAMELYRTAASAGNDSCWSNIYALQYQINENKKGNYDNEGMMLFLDYLHVKGLDLVKDEWMPILTRSAELGYPPAQVDMWIIYRDDKQTGKGLPYLQKAVDANYIPAFFLLGHAYHMGLINKKPDYKEAQKWYEKAAVGGHPIAQNNLAALYYNNNISSLQGNGVMANYWWTVSAEQGYSDAASNKKLVENYRTSQEIALKNLESILNIMNASLKTYNSLNQSRVRSYVPPKSTQQAAQSNTSTASSSSSSTNNRVSTTSTSQPSSSEKEQKCGSCGGDGKCDFNFCNGSGKVDCGLCNGDGIETGIGFGKRTCTNCKGSGKKQCGVCRGSGKCQRCKGTGKV